MVIRRMDVGDIDLAILDGEAVPAGGMGIARQLKDEIYRCPPVLVLTGRPQDAWLATWSRAEAARAAPDRPAAAGRAGDRTAAGAGRGRPRAPRDQALRDVTEHSWPEVLGALVARRDLDAEQTAWAMQEVFTGDATPAQIAGFAIALRAKGETVDEVEGLVRTMYAHAQPLEVPGRLVDIVGTGGDRARTVNISTMAAVVAAGTGARVVKHGNRAASSASGSADVLEQLGVSLDLTPQRVGEVAVEAGITYCFAPVFHSSLRHAAGARRELGIATIFNFLGPLTNPARPAAQAVGVFDAADGAGDGGGAGPAWS